MRPLTTAEVLAAYGNPPLTNREAWEVYEHFMEDERVTFLHELEGVEETWQKLATRDTASPKVWMDAYLAAFAIGGALRFVTLDHDFKGFVAQGLDLVLLNP